MISLEQVIEKAKGDDPKMIDRKLYGLLNRLLNIHGHKLHVLSLDGDEAMVTVVKLAEEFAS